MSEAGRWRVGSSWRLEVVIYARELIITSFKPLSIFTDRGILLIKSHHSFLTQLSFVARLMHSLLISSLQNVQESRSHLRTHFSEVLEASIRYIGPMVNKEQDDRYGWLQELANTTHELMLKHRIRRIRCKLEVAMRITSVLVKIEARSVI